nr:MAG TPA_asm: hypothetical protein [Caudoviricetes sp.]
MCIYNYFRALYDTIMCHKLSQMMFGLHVVITL